MFKSIGFQQSKLDPCLSIRQKNGRITYILIYVLGIEVEKSNAGCKQNRAAYIRKLVLRFDMENAKRLDSFQPGLFSAKTKISKQINFQCFWIGGFLTR